MKITFILPGNDDTPVGGYKIIYQYANQLVEMGHDITIAFMYHPYSFQNRYLKLLEYKLKLNFGYTGNKESVSWFQLDKKINIVKNLILESDLPKADKIIATAPETAILLSKFSDNVGEKYYFIQNYEVWNLGPKKLHKTYRLPLKKIVIANWLGKKVFEVTGKNPVRVPNFYNQSVFYLEKNIEDRNNVVSLLNHKEPTKRTKFGLEILAEVQKSIPDLQVRLFGTGEKPTNLPDYVTYYQKPTQEVLRSEVYGSSKIYLMPTILEGWSLTGMEAMASGAVVVGSDIGGLQDYITNEIEGILINQDEFQIYVDQVIDILKSDDKRLKLSKDALISVQKHQIENSIKFFLEALS